MSAIRGPRSRSWVDRANCNGCGSKWDNRLFADVDSFKPNPFGLYGMLGNAWQWTADCWHPNYVDAPENGSAWKDERCDKHVIRGGSWKQSPGFRALGGAERQRPQQR